MAYTAFTENKPVANESGLVAVDYMRDNSMALRDACIIGRMYGFDYSFTGGTAAAPTESLYSSGTERLKITRTWSGVDNLKNRYYYSSDSGGAYDFIAREQMTYTTNSLTTSTWDQTDA